MFFYALFVPAIAYSSGTVGELNKLCCGVPHNEKINKMKQKNGNYLATASNAATAHLRDGQAVEKLEKDSNILYDLFDLEKIFKVTKRTLFNWRAKGELPLIEFGGKLYLSKGQLRELIIQKGGNL